ERSGARQDREAHCLAVASLRVRHAKWGALGGLSDDRRVPPSSLLVFLLESFEEQGPYLSFVRQAVHAPSCAAPPFLPAGGQPTAEAPPPELQVPPGPPRHGRHPGPATQSKGWLRSCLRRLAHWPRLRPALAGGRLEHQPARQGTSQTWTVKKRWLLCS